MTSTKWVGNGSNGSSTRRRRRRRAPSCSLLAVAAATAAVDPPVGPEGAANREIGDNQTYVRVYVAGMYYVSNYEAHLSMYQRDFKQ